MLLSLALPIGLSAIALFFASFVSWTISGLHQGDWRRLPNEEDFLRSVKPLGLEPGNYMFPAPPRPGAQQDPMYQEKWNAGPRGVMTVFASMDMLRNLILTFSYFLVVSFCLAYLGTLALPAGADFMRVFRFLSTAAFLTYLAAILQHSIWFRCRVVGHVVESVVYAAITGVIFAAFWPAA